MKVSNPFLYLTVDGHCWCIHRVQTGEHKGMIEIKRRQPVRWSTPDGQCYVKATLADMKANSDTVQVLFRVLKAAEEAANPSPKKTGHVEY